MDILLSLPIVSYFLSPGATSWSTSLNILFFYMTWTTLVLSYPPLHIELAGVLAIRLLAWLVPSLLFLLVDTLLPSLAEHLKFGGAAALPPRSPALLAKLLLLAALNLVLEAALQAGVGLLWTAASTLLLKKAAHPLFRTSSALPLPWQVFKQVGLLMAGREVLTYAVHRFVLSRPGSSSRVVRRLSRWHTQSCAHARAAPPFSLLLFADHPASFLLLRFLPLYAAALAVRPHLLVFFLFVGLATVEETLAMSGYSVVPGILLRGIARRTAAHYSEDPSGDGSGHNFGAWGVLDWAQGTSSARSIVQDAEDEVAAHESKRRTRGAGREVKKEGKNTVTRKTRRRA